MRALSKWVEENENFLANLSAFIMTFLLLLFICQATRANDVAPPVYTEDVFVFSRNKAGSWTYRAGKVKQFPNTFPVICFELPKHVVVQCFYINGNGLGSLYDMELVGEKPT